MANTVRLQARDLALANGAAVGTWSNPGSAGGSWTEATNRPTYQTTGLAGKPCVRFDGVNDVLNNTVNLTNFIAVGAFMGILVFRCSDIDTGSDDASLGQNNDCIFVDITNSHLGISLRRTGPKLQFWYSTQNIEPTHEFSFSLGSVVLLSFYRTGGVTYAAINGGSYVGVTEADAAGLTGDMRIGANSGGGKLFQGDVGEIWLWNTVDTAELASEVAELLLYYGITQLGVNQAREVASREIRLRRAPIAQVQEALPLAFMHRPPLQPVYLAHRDAPSVLGLGWETDEPALAVPLSLQPDYQGITVNVRWLLLDDITVTHWDTMVSELTPDNNRDGVAYASLGQRVFARNAKAYIEDPAATKQGARSLVEVAVDKPKMAPLGELLEGARTNGLLRSSFVNGLTGWTPSGASGSVAAATDRLLFLSAITPNSAKFTAGNPHSADLVLTSTATGSYSANTIVCVSAWVESINGEPLKWRLQRSIDSWFWNDTSGAWQSGAVDNDFNNLTVGSGIAHLCWSKAIDVGGGATTLTFSARLLSGGTASRVSYLYHAQIENGPYPTSVIVTTTAAVTRDADALYVTSDHGARTWPEQGHFRLQWNPLMATSGLTTGRILTLLDYYLDADNYVRLTYEQAITGYRFRHRIGAANSDVTISATLTRGTWETIAGRWTGSRGELGLSPYTIDLFRAGVKGTAAVPGGTLRPLLSQMKLRIGHRDNSGVAADCLDGHMRYLTISPRVPPDGKMVEV